MEVAAAVAAAAASAGSAIASAASAAAPVLGTIGTVASIASPFIGIAGSLASAGLRVSGEQQQVRAATVQANQQEVAAQQEELRGQESANQVREALLRTIATQRAQYAAAGIALDEGTPQTVEDATRREAERELAIQRGNTAFAAGNSRLNAQLLRDRAASIQGTSNISAGLSLFEAVDRLSQRMPAHVTAERTGTFGAAKGIP